MRTASFFISKNSKKVGEICSELLRKNKSEHSQYRQAGVYLCNFEQRSYAVLLRLLLTLTHFSPIYPLKTSKNQRFSDIFRGYIHETLA